MRRSNSIAPFLKAKLCFQKQKRSTAGDEIVARVCCGSLSHEAESLKENIFTRHCCSALSKSHCITEYRASTKIETFKFITKVILKLTK